MSSSSEIQESSSSSPIRVCVTGATGFIASHIVYQLLRKGYIVHATVRSVEKGRREIINNIRDYESKNTEVGKLDQKVLDERLICFEADLLKEGSFKDAIEGCRFVHHTASPFKVHVQDAKRDLVDPAVKGTLNVLQECVKLRKLQRNDDPSRLQRIILTSSIASITDSAKPNRVYNEKDWNEESSLTYNPYLYSKVMAEKAAWQYLQKAQLEHGNEFIELVTLCPAVVIGPPMNPRLISQSHESIMLMARGEFPVILPLDFPFVDVRDVAKAHVLAMEHNMNDRSCFAPYKVERFIISNGETTSMKDLVKQMREAKVPPYKWAKNLPTISLYGYIGIGVGRLAALLQPKGLRQYLTSILGKPLYFDNSKAKRVLGLEFKNWKDSVTDSVKFLDENGFILSKL
ncbi:hypothetical protein FDP41_012252 [Naegleria fowleri]|uniref:NAD-dependent epimerase/dehydratase domain-containing protein n=1 Tax=Naegleria fowleri TaxID=5763 RepID=A0A6A5C825_NAEFO|nr:uncharacterized protein FDP41_012252 [Naegleria fowleri]KAF0981595.1 hypothetical protein FDP41_012252 [Naegleria fowleri]CAG4715850.1 unnamed protein product [Naegleria fowleri]